MPLYTMRWYEKYPLAKEAIELWRNYPPGLQKVIGRHVYKYNQKMKSFSYSPFRLDDLPKLIAPLYLAFQRRRWYDKDPIVRKAFNSLADLRVEHLLEISERIVMLKVHIKSHAIQVDNMPEKEMDKLVEHIFTIDKKQFFFRQNA